MTGPHYEADTSIHIQDSGLSTPCSSMRSALATARQSAIMAMTLIPCKITTCVQTLQTAPRASWELAAAFHPRL